MLIYVCSPLRGTKEPYTRPQINQNLRRTSEYCRKVIMQGHTPIAPHLFYSSCLNDLIPFEREHGLRMCEELIPKSDELWIFGSEISPGMAHDIEIAKQLGIPIINNP